MTSPTVAWSRHMGRQIRQCFSFLFLSTGLIMIKSVLIFNNHGKPRLTKFYQQIDIATQQALIQEIYSLVSKRPDTVCNFLEGSQLLGGKDTRIIYRHYATLYFVFVVDESESELGILDLIQVHHILSEVVQGGMVLETNMTEIVAAIQELNKAKKKPGAALGGAALGVANAGGIALKAATEAVGRGFSRH
ncbi:clathrin adaptor complex small chain-domain-containing protein [Jimgerdemannia flammicorona]|uniref:Clathrin adaptor complex small chain-domain-containing protein n=1 Tax=Jimgerdemannia flammicorona TaxID=994334 RepID=A0A433QAQ8_9FUNG|nr:clathrin adaptor complex small chain-domain-containing protein [Jimgerdemannia flammicorona]